MKKFFACILCVLMMVFLVTGCEGVKPETTTESVGTEDAQEEAGSSSSSSSENASEEGTAENTEAATTETSDYDAIANEKAAWWFMRNKEHAQPSAQEDIDLSQYDAYYVDTDCDEKVIYLTFDCGYENGYTESILDTLKEKDVKAIFFVTWGYINSNPELVTRMKEEGHLVGNHTISHPSMPSKTIDELKEEIIGCANYMKEQTGYDMDMYIRPPMGEYSERTLQLCKDLGYKTIFWSIAYLDYDVNNQPGSNYVIEHFRQYHHPGAIPLIHNVSQSNAEALPALIDMLKEEGYRFGTLNEL